MYKKIRVFRSINKEHKMKYKVCFYSSHIHGQKPVAIIFSNDNKLEEFVGDRNIH